MATFLKKIHTTDEDELNLGKDLLKFLTETLELDLNSLHIMFKNIFNLPVVLVLNFRKTLKRSECEYVKQKHMTRNYEFERRLTRLKIIPKSSRVVFFVVKRSRSRKHPFETYQKMATIRLQDTYLRFLNSGKARHRLTTIPPSYVIEGRTMLPSREVDDAFSKRCQLRIVRPYHCFFVFFLFQLSSSFYDDSQRDVEKSFSSSLFSLDIFSQHLSNCPMYE